MQVLFLDGALLVGADHWDSGVQGGVDFRVVVGGEAMAEGCEALGQLGPEGDAGAHRHIGVDGSEGADMLRLDLAARSSAVGEAGLEAAPLGAELTNMSWHDNGGTENERDEQDDEPERHHSPSISPRALPSRKSPRIRRRQRRPSPTP